MDQIVGGLNPMEYRRSLGLFNSGSRLRPHLRITVMCKCLTLFSPPLKVEVAVTEGSL